MHIAFDGETSWVGKLRLWEGGVAIGEPCATRAVGERGQGKLMIGCVRLERLWLRYGRCLRGCKGVPKGRGGMEIVAPPRVRRPGARQRRSHFCRSAAADRNPSDQAKCAKCDFGVI